MKKQLFRAMAISAALAFPLAACDDDDLDDAADNVEESVEDVGDDIEDGLENAEDELDGDG